MSALDDVAIRLLRSMLDGVEAGRLVVVAVAGADHPEPPSLSVRCTLAEPSTAAATAATAAAVPQPMSCPTCMSVAVRRFDEDWGCCSCGAEWPAGEDLNGLPAGDDDT